MFAVETHGAHIPALGFGTFQLGFDVARRMVAEALAIGYRHIDTAQLYGNEHEVGLGLRDSRLARDSVFVTTKVWPDNYADGALQRSVEQSLRQLGLEHVDLLLLHWPRFAMASVEETIGALNDVKRRGLAAHIGISNFNTHLIRLAVELSDAPLAVNQVEYHPYLSQQAVIAELQAQKMALTAYSPVAQGKVMKEKLLNEIGTAHGKNAAQVSLRWLIQQPGVIAIPRSSKRLHAKTNFEIFDFELNEDEMQAIHALARADGRIIRPAGLAPSWD